MKVQYIAVVETVRFPDGAYRRTSSGRWRKWTGDEGWWPVDPDKERRLEDAYQEYKAEEQD